MLQDVMLTIQAVSSAEAIDIAFSLPGFSLNGSYIPEPMADGNFAVVGRVSQPVTDPRVKVLNCPQSQPFSAGNTRGTLRQTTIVAGSYSGIKDRRLEAVKTTTSWKRLWSEHLSTSCPPEINFVSEMVVAVFAGTFCSSGYDVEILSVEEHDKTVVATYRVSGGGLIFEACQPFHIVHVPKSDKPVRFQPA